MPVPRTPSEIHEADRTIDGPSGPGVGTKRHIVNIRAVLNANFYGQKFTTTAIIAAMKDRGIVHIPTIREAAGYIPKIKGVTPVGWAYAPQKCRVWYYGPTPP